MTSRYFFRTFRRLLLFSSTHIPLSIRNNRLVLTSLGTAAIITTTIYKTSPFEQLTRSFIVHAKALDKDLSPTGMKILSFLITINSLFIEKQFFQAAHDGQLEVLQK
jgi:hypothetical protein